jgi:hypothetical protein
MTDAPVKGDKVSWVGVHVKKRYFGEVAEVLEDVYKIRTHPHRILLTVKSDRVHKE